jgi:hypothetical protein
MATRPGRLEFANYVLGFTTRPRCSASEVLIRTSISFISEPTNYSVAAERSRFGSNHGQTFPYAFYGRVADDT